MSRLKMKEHMNREHTTATKTCSICNKVGRWWSTYMTENLAGNHIHHIFLSFQCRVSSKSTAWNIIWTSFIRIFPILLPMVIIDCYDCFWCDREWYDGYWYGCYFVPLLSFNHLISGFPSDTVSYFFPTQARVTCATIAAPASLRRAAWTSIDTRDT